MNRDQPSVEEFIECKKETACDIKVVKERSGPQITANRSKQKLSDREKNYVKFFFTIFADHDRLLIKKLISLKDV